MDTDQDIVPPLKPTSALRALLIDIDNCPRQLERLPEILAAYTRVIACYGGSEPKVPLGMVPVLATAIHDGRLAIIGMQKKGKNAADFGLAFWAGRLAAEMPPNTEFCILSQDTDLDHVVYMLQDANRQVERLDGKVQRTRRTVAAPPEPSAESNGDVVGEYCTVYLQPARSRPVRKVTLANSIRAFCKNHKKNIKPEEILQGLVERGVVAIDAKGRVTYPELAATAPTVLTATVMSEAPEAPEMPAVESAVSC
jgi:hypothetical protein